MLQWFNHIPVEDSILPKLRLRSFVNILHRSFIIADSWPVDNFPTLGEVHIMGIHDKYTDGQIKELKNIFCKAYEKRGLYHRAAEVAGMTGSEVEELLKEDPEFAAEYEISKQRFVENLEDVAIKKSMAGESDSLLQFLLRANKPEKYNPSTALNVQPGAGAKVMLMFSESELTEEERKRVQFMNPEEIDRG